MRVYQHNVLPSAPAGMVVDLSLCFAAVLFAASTLTSRYMTIPDAVPELPLILFGATFFALVMALMYALVGLYRPKSISLPAKAARTILAICIGGYLTSLTLRIVADRGYIEQLIPAAIAYLAVGLVISRGCFYVMQRVTTLPSVLIVGTGEEAQAIASDLRVPGRTARNVIGFFSTSDGDEESEQTLQGIRVFPNKSSITDLANRYAVSEIVVAVREHRGGGIPMEQLLECRIRGISEKGFIQGGFRRIMKRLFDIITSSILLLITMPVMALAILAIWLDSPGPIIYRQARVGLGGRVFMCMKFRSMRIDAEKDGVAKWASKNDPRITRVGSFMRKTRIDELPQLFSVLMGEMSLVGPRPERPTFVDQLKVDVPFYELRHSVKPGITGWAQVRYHYGGSLEDARKKHQFDLYYVKNNSLFLDIIVLIETVSVVLFREGQ